MVTDKILIVDDEPDAIENCRRMLRRHRYECVGEADSHRALAAIQRERPQVLLTDLRMPGLDGIELLKAAKRIDPGIRVVLVTAYASIQTAVASMRHGAFDYLAKPFTGQELRTVVQRALGESTGDSREGEESAIPPTKGLALLVRSSYEGGLIGHSAATQAVREVIERVRGTEAAVLISGEIGTGKEYVARMIHAGSARRSKPFVPVDCLGCDEAAMDIQLFGTEPSAGSQPSLLESVQGGTLFLREVNALSPRLQAKIARTMKERRGRRAGGTQSFDVDVRMLAGSTQDVQRLCARGEFREDLYSSLSVVPLALRPLRERVEDIDALAEWFLAAFLARTYGLPPVRPDIMPRTYRRLRRYAWPGNVRELRQVVELAAMLAERAPIDLIHLPDRLRA
ncbi:sigma-54-dependent transcriptional regulator [Nitrospira sp. NS4]|uniref:sigma-54-dependent transcriptional regulator n=1 Tax=Nitrospira sp. NS4 TaxID=3414498 RepID=UPI003C30B389